MPAKFKGKKLPHFVRHAMERLRAGRALRGFFSLAVFFYFVCGGDDTQTNKQNKLHDC